MSQYNTAKCHSEAPCSVRHRQHWHSVTVKHRTVLDRNGAYICSCGLIFCRFALNLCQSPTWKGWEIACLTTVIETLKCETILRSAIIKVGKNRLKCTQPLLCWNCPMWCNATFFWNPSAAVIQDLNARCSRRLTLALANFPIPINQIKIKKHSQT